MTSLTNKTELLKVDTRGRGRCSRERREAILDAFERSGMSGATFAASHGINYQTFWSWLRKRKRCRASSPPALSLAEIVVERPAQPSPSRGEHLSLRVRLPGEAIIEVDPSAASIALAVELLKALRSSC